MRTGWGLGPVFAFECLRGARRWQGYAGRVLFLVGLLVGLGLTWSDADVSIRELSVIGRRYFLVMIAIQMAVVLFAAPAATAGAICVDKGRGALLHAFVTDLSPREIVTGKLAARLVPVLGLIACGLPVLACSGLLGGVDALSALGAYLTTAGVALVGCALALTFSVWAKKPHQALLPTYAVLGLWLGLDPALHLVLGWTLGPPATPLQAAAQASNPVLVAFAREVDPAGGHLAEQAAFLGSLVLISGLLLAIASKWIRPVVVSQSSESSRRGKPGWPARLLALLPGPALDDNPVLWREWHRKKPTRWTGRFWSAYAIASALASLFVIVNYFIQPLQGIHWVAAQVNAWEVAIGLLLLSVSAATSLAEERDRGSLDVVMATPLPSRTILWGKWWGTLAMVPRLAILPIWVTSAMALVSGNWAGPILMIAFIFASSLAITSLGLALATWIPRLGRAVTASVLAFVLMTVGWSLLIEVAFIPQRLARGISRDPRDVEKLLLGNPYFAVLRTTEYAGRFGTGSYYNRYNGQYVYGADWLDSEIGWPLFWLFVYSSGSSLLLLATIWSFDRCLGRTPEQSGRTRDRLERLGSPAIQRDLTAVP